MEQRKSDLVWVREKLNVSQTDLAELVGIDRSLFSHVEKSRRSIASKPSRKLEQIVRNVRKIDEELEKKETVPGLLNAAETITKAEKISGKLEFEMGRLQYKIDKKKTANESCERSIHILSLLQPGEHSTEAEKRAFRKWKDYLLTSKINEYERDTEQLLELEIRLASKTAAYNVVRSFLGR